MRVSALEIFPRYQFDLQARDDGKFDILFRNRERDGWGDSKLEKLFLLLRGLPFQSVTPEVYNLRHQAINFVSMYRWDAEKRRVLGQLSGPFKGESEISLWIAGRPTQRELGHQEFVSRSGSRAGQLQYAARSCECQLCCPGKRTLALVCRRRDFSSRLPQRDSRNVA